MVDVSPLLKEDYPAIDEGGNQENVAPDSPVNDSEEVVIPSAPPETVVGYEGASFNEGHSLAPPPYNEVVETSNRSVLDQQTAAIPTHVTEQEARDALLQLADHKFCWGKKAAREMVVASITSTSAFHYKLETFTEARKTTWGFVPYHGGIVDGPQNGPAPSPWSVVIRPDAMFKNHQKQCEVPHTAYVKECHGCTGMGRVICRSCNGGGRMLCNRCRGKGFTVRTHTQHGHDHSHTHDDEHVKCHFCHGTGHRICSRCGGCGRVNCGTCNAKGQLRYFIRLTVIWTMHTNDHIVETTAMPDHLIRGARGAVAFEESSPRVNALSHFPNPEVNGASLRLVQQHNTLCTTEQILMQRHNVRVIPVSEVQGDHLGKEFTFWVYGNDNLCHADQYPHKYCCGCSIL